MLRFARDEDHERLLELLRKAGLPSEPRPSSTSASKPAIAVLPFTNAGGDPEQQYFSDGLAEDIITELGRFRSLFVIAPHSSFRFRGRSIDVPHIGRDLGVRYIVEGSVRQAGGRVRVTAQLVEADSGNQIWADRFDRELEDIFAVQDELTRSIVGCLVVRLEDRDFDIARRKPPERLQAYDYWLRGKKCLDQATADGNDAARRFFEQCLAVDLDYARGYAGLAEASYSRAFYEAGPTFLDALKIAMAHAEKAVSLDDTDARPHCVLGWTCMFLRDFGRAERHFEFAATLNPSDADVMMNWACARALLGEPEAARGHAEEAMRLNPHCPGWYLEFLTLINFAARRYEDVLATAAKGPDIYPSSPAWRAAACAYLGRLDEARLHAETLTDRLRSIWTGRHPANFRELAEYLCRTVPFRKSEDAAHLLEGLFKAERKGLHQSIQEAATTGERGSPTAACSKPTIAVLPFTNAGGDAEQQYFSDGLTEDIITELSRYRSLLVIARNSCFQFRGPSIDIVAVRSKLGVRYVVEGSVRRVGTRLHLTARLIDALNESHVWAERYDRDVGDIFALQDDMTRAIAATLEGRVAASGAEQARRRPTRDWQAYDYFLQGRELGHRYDFVRSEPYFARAIELDHGFAQAHAWRAHALLGMYWRERRAELLDEVLQCARTALSLDDADSWCHLTMGFALSHRGRLDLAGPHVERAIALNPTDVHVAILRAWWLARVGRTDEAIEVLDAAMHRDPFPPQWLWEVRAIALMQARRCEEAILALGRMSDLYVWDHAYLAACHARLGRATEARAAAAEVLRLDPQFTVRRYGEIEWFKSPADHEHLLEGMRMAGLPE
jgi:TolB-like protein/Tfp pilus assembly protein PilF